MHRGHIHDPRTCEADPALRFKMGRSISHGRDGGRTRVRWRALNAAGEGREPDRGGRGVTVVAAIRNGDEGPALLRIRHAP